MSAFPIPLNEPFADWQGLLFEEEQALYIAFSNLFVKDNNGVDRPVQIIWPIPQRTMNPGAKNQNAMGDSRGVPQITYPNIEVALLEGPVRDPEREHRGYVWTQYEQNSGNLIGDDGELGTMEVPIPAKITYQISVNATYLQHARQLVNMLSWTVLAPRYGVLICPSGTVRRLDVVSGPRELRQIRASDQVLFRYIWVIEISSEWDYGYETGTPADTVELSVGPMTGQSDIPTETLTVDPLP